MAADKERQLSSIQQKSVNTLLADAQKYLENVEKSMGNLLKKFHLNDNTLKENYHSKINALQDNLKNEKMQLNKGAFVSSLISLTLQERGVVVNELTIEAKKHLKGADLAEFEKDKNKFLQNNNTNEFQELRKDLVDASKNLGNMGEVVVSNKEVSARDGLKQQSISLLEKRLRKQIGQKEFENGMAKIMNEADRFNIETEIAQALGNKIKEIDLSQAKKVGERSMTSGILPLGMIMTPGLKRVIPILPAVIGLGIWARLMHGSAMDKTMAVGETALYIAPITGTFMSGKDTIESLQKYREGKGEMGDVVANGVGTIVSAGFDAVTILAVASGVGTPAAVGLTAVRGAAKESVVIGIKKVTQIFTKEAIEIGEKNYAEGFIKTSTKFVVENSKIVFTTIVKHPVKVIQHAIKETGEGMHSLLTLKTIRESKPLAKINEATFGKASDAILPAKIKAFEALEKAHIVPKGAAERVATSHIEGRLVLNETRPEDSETFEKEGLKDLEKSKSSKSLDLLLQKINEISKNDNSNELLQESLKVLETKDYYIGNSLGCIKEIREKINSGKSTKEIKEEIAIIKNKYNGKISENLGKLISKIEKSIEGRKLKDLQEINKILENKINGSHKEETELFIKFETDVSNSGCYTNCIKTSVELEKLLAKADGKSRNSQTLIESYLDILKQSDRQGWGLLRFEELGKLGHLDNSHYSAYEMKVGEILKDKKFENISIELIKGLDLSLIRDPNIVKVINDKVVDYVNNNFKEKDIFDIINKFNIEGGSRFTLEFKSGTLGKLLKFSKNEKEKLLLIELMKGEEKLIQTTQSQLLENIKNKNWEKTSSDELDVTMNMLTKLNDDKKLKDTYTEIIKKSINKKGELSKEDIISFINGSENNGKGEKAASYELKAKLIKIYEDELAGAKDELISSIISDKNHSIEYKIKFSKEINKPDVYKSLIDNILSDLKYDSKGKLQEETNILVITKLEKIKDLIKIAGLDDIKLNFIKQLEETSIYKSLNRDVERSAEELCKSWKTYSYEELMRMKNNGLINEKTIERIRWEIRTNDNPIIIQKLLILEKTLKKVVDTYQFTLFNKNDYEKIDSEEGKVDYIRNIIRQSANNLVIGDKVINPKELNKVIIRELANFKSNFGVDNVIIRRYLETAMKRNNLKGFDIETKIKLIDTLERTGVINPRAEEKMSYIESIKESGVDELRADISYIKDYISKLEKQIESEHSTGKYKYGFLEIENNSKTNINGKKVTIHFSDKLENENNYQIRMILDEINNGRTGLKAKNETDSILYELRVDAGEYVKIGDEYFALRMNPNRYFLNQFLKADNHKRAEAYMELIHDKSNLGGQNIKEIFEAPNTPVDKKLLLAYHDDLKYDSKALELLIKEYQNPEHAETVLYVMQKRKDVDLTKDGNEIKVFEREILDKLITKEFVEQKEGRSLTDEEYKDKKKMIIDVILLSKNPKIQTLIQSIRMGEETSEEATRLTNEISKTFRESKELTKEDRIFADFINENKDIFARMLGEKAKLLDDIQKLHNSDAIKSIILGIRGNNTLSGEEKVFAEEFIKVYENSDIIAKTGKEYNNLTGNVEKLLASLTIIIASIRAGAEQNREKFKDINPLETHISINSDLKEKFDLLGITEKIFTPKKMISTLIILGIMKPTEARAAEQEIGDKWQSSPEFKEYQRLGGEKSEAAKKLKEDTIRAITTEVLKPYIASFDAKYQAMMEKKIQEIPLGLQTLLANIDTKIMEKINKNHSPTEINMLNTFIYQYIKSIKDDGGACVSNLDKITSKFPELAGTDVDKFLREIGTNYDNAAKASANADKASANADKAEKLNKELDIIIDKMKKM